MLQRNFKIVIPLKILQNTGWYIKRNRNIYFPLYYLSDLVSNFYLMYRVVQSFRNGVYFRMSNENDRIYSC